MKLFFSFFLLFLMAIMFSPSSFAVIQVGEDVNRVTLDKGNKLLLCEVAGEEEGSSDVLPSKDQCKDQKLIEAILSQVTIYTSTESSSSEAAELEPEIESEIQDLLLIGQELYLITSDDSNTSSQTYTLSLYDGEKNTFDKVSGELSYSYNSDNQIESFLLRLDGKIYRFLSLEKTVIDETIVDYWLIYEDSEYGLKFEYPSQYRVRKDDEKKQIIVYEPTTMTPKIILSLFENPQPLTYENWLDMKLTVPANATEITVDVLNELEGETSEDDEMFQAFQKTSDRYLTYSLPCESCSGKITTHNQQLKELSYQLTGEEYDKFDRLMSISIYTPEGISNTEDDKQLLADFMKRFGSYSSFEYEDYVATNYFQYKTPPRGWGLSGGPNEFETGMSQNGYINGKLQLISSKIKIVAKEEKKGTTLEQVYAKYKQTLRNVPEPSVIQTTLGGEPALAYEQITSVGERNYGVFAISKDNVSYSIYLTGFPVLGTDRLYNYILDSIKFYNRKLRTQLYSKEEIEGIPIYPQASFFIKEEYPPCPKHVGLFSIGYYCGGFGYEFHSKDTFNTVVSYYEENKSNSRYVCKMMEGNNDVDISLSCSDKEDVFEIRLTNDSDIEFQPEDDEAYSTRIELLRPFSNP